MGACLYLAHLGYVEIELSWTLDGDSDNSEVKVGLHQGSVPSPMLFIIVMYVVSRGAGEIAVGASTPSSSV